MANNIITCRIVKGLNDCNTSWNFQIIIYILVFLSYTYIISSLQFMEKPHEVQISSKIRVNNGKI